MLEIGSAKCHVLDLLVSLHEERVRRGWSRAPTWGGGFAEGKGLRHRRGCGPEITVAFDGAWACSVGDRNHLCLKEISAAASIWNDWM